MKKVIDPSKLDTKAIERLAKINREKSLKEMKELKEAEDTGKEIKNKTNRQEEYENERARKFFNEMKERDF